MITSDDIPLCQRSTEISVCIMMMKLSHSFFLIYFSIFPVQLATLSLLSCSSISPTFPMYLLFSQCLCLSQCAFFLLQSFIAHLNNLNSLHVPEGRAGAHGSAEDEDRGGKEESKKWERRDKEKPNLDGKIEGTNTNVQIHCEEKMDDR